MCAQRLLPARVPLAAVLGTAAVVLAALPAAAADAASQRGRTTTLLSRAWHGGFPNGPSFGAAMSHDQRIARWAAFESDASDIVRGDTNGHRDVFLVPRAGSWGRNGTPWEAGTARLASTGMGGAPANGRSWGAVLDGGSHSEPRCVAFISEASNLVPGDTNGVADAFVRDLRTGRITRVSVASDGRQANGPTESVQLDDHCERVAFTARATNLALTRTRRLEWRTAVTRRPARGTRQVYVRVIGHTSRYDRGFVGLTFLASAGQAGRPGNGDSHEPAFARSGKHLAFTTTASNLVRGDRDRDADVVARSFTRKFRRYPRLNNRGANQFRFTTWLASATPSGRSGNGASGHPGITDDGAYVVFQTDASDLAPGDPNRFRDIVRAQHLGGGRVRQVAVTRSASVGWADGPSHHPVITDAREGVFFESHATNLRATAAHTRDTNGVSDVFFWNEPTGNISLESRDSDNGFLEAASTDPATSSRGNYVPFESEDRGIDRPLLRRLGVPLVDAVEDLLDVVDRGGGVPGLPTGRARHQVYLRYLGPE